MRTRFRTEVLVALLLLNACEVPDRDLLIGEERDSAGVRIVELPSDEAEVRRYELPLDPSWDPAAGLETGDLLDIELAPSGGVLLLDELAGAITLVSESGVVLAEIGRDGEGPGEFSPRGLSQVIATDSSILVPDLFLQRLTEFRLDGEVLGTWPFPLAPVYALDWQRHPEGGLVFRAFEEAGDLLIRWDRETVDTLLALTDPNDFGNLLLSPITIWDLGIDGHPIVARTNRAAVESRRLGSGELIWRAQWARVVDELDEMDVRRLEGFVRERILQETPNVSGELLQQNLASVEYPSEPPVLAGVRVTESGDVWVRRANPIQSIAPGCLQVGSAEACGGREWDVLDRAGYLKARVSLPEGFSPRRFREGWIYGILADEMGVESVARVAIGF